MSTQILLRPYQADLIEKSRTRFRTGLRALLLQLGTGGGKTIIFCAIAAAALARGRRVLVVVHRRELYRQAAAKLELAGVSPGIIAAGVPPEPERQVQVASIQTLLNRLDTLPAFDLIILDEAHHARAAQWQRLLAAQPQAKILGVTATPCRLDGKGLGASDDGIFDDLITGPSITELVKGGFLSPAKCFVPERRLDMDGVRVQAGDYSATDLDRFMETNRAIIGDAVAQYRRHADGKPAIAFCVSVRHAHDVAREFQDAGYRAVCAHGEMKTEDRDAAIAGLGTGEVQVLTSCDLISEGLDVPAVSAVILLRPTKSVALFMQQVGRGMRPAAGKDALYVLDHVGNCITHGLPDAPRTWTLSGVEKRHTGREGAQPTWRCECGCLNPLSEPHCAECREPRPSRDRDIERLKGELAELTPESLRAMRGMSFRQMASKRRSEAELREFAKARGYKTGWVHHWMREQATRQYASGAVAA